MTHDDALPALSGPRETPLVDLLQAVPTEARMVYEHGPFESQMIPVGRLCHEAQAEIRVLRAQLAALAARAVPDDVQREALRRLWPLIEKGTRGFAFTADKAGEVAADKNTLRQWIDAPVPGEGGGA